MSKHKLFLSKPALRFFQSACIIILVQLPYSIAHSNPSGGTVTSGDATINQTPGSTVINQQSQQAIINWNSFNIGAGETTHFQQPANGVALNRINPQQGASQIYGSLTATGTIILINQSGVYFGPGSYVNVGGIIVSTADISDQHFLAGKYIFDQASPYHGTIINQGNIFADHGLVALIGSNISNTGYIQANYGQVILASGDKFTFDLTGDGLINFSIDQPSSGSGVDQNGNPMRTGVSNSGTIIANGGSILLTAQDAQGIVDSAINMTGVLQAQSIAQQNGEIILLSDNTGSINVSGKIDVSGYDSGETGGTAKILGGKIYVNAPTIIDANGDAGGGEILIGGNVHGAGPEPDAYETVVEPGVLVTANAVLDGNGGTIVAWANQVTGFFGDISARGGVEGGNGGFVETSGKISLDVSGINVDLLAPHGTTGNWLLDPTDITICDSCTTTLTMLLLDDTYSEAVALSTAMLSSADLGNALNSANITVTTADIIGTGTGNITVSGVSGLESNWSSGSNTTLTLQADNNIVINTNISLSGSGKTVDLNAPNGSITINNTVDGNFNLNASASTSSGAVTFAQVVGGSSALASVTVNADTINLENNVTTIGSQSYTASSTNANAVQIDGTYTTNDAPFSTSGNTQLAGSSVIDTSGGLVTMTNALTGATANAENLTINSGSGNINFDSTIDSLENLSLTSSGTITFSNTVGGTTALSSITAGSGGAITVDANVTTSGAQTYSDNMTLGGNAIFTSTGNDISMLAVAGGGNSLTLNNAGSSSEISGVISNISSLIKQGSGTLNLAGANTYSTATTVSDGILLVSNATGLGTTASGTTVSSGAILDIDGVAIGAENINLNGAEIMGTGTASLAGNITLGGNSTLGGTGTLTLSGIISGGFNLTKVDAGTVNLSGNNNYTGTTTINAGILSINNSNGLGNFSVGPTVNSGGTLDLNGTTLSLSSGISLTLNGTGASGVGALTGTGTSSISGSGDIDLATNVAIGGSGTLTINTSIIGSANLTKIGSGTLILSNTSNAYTGSTTINAGILQLGNSNALPTTTAVTLANVAGVIFNLNNYNQIIGTLSGGGSLGGNISLGSATLTVNQGADATYAGVISGSGGLTTAGSNMLTLYGVNTYTGATTINAGTLQLGVDDAINIDSDVTVSSGATFALDNFNDAIGSLAGAGDVTLGSGTLNTGNDNTSTTFSGDISGTGNLTKSGSGTFTLASANAFSGNTDINAGTLNIENSSALGTSAVTVSSGATLSLTGNGLSVGNNLTLDGSGVGGAGALLDASSGSANTYAGNILLGSNVTMGVTNSNETLTVSGTINGTGFGITKTGSGTLILGKANTYTGATNINAGTLQLGVNNAINSDSAVTVSSGATFALNNFNDAIGSLAGAGDVTLGSGTLNTGNDNTSTTFSGDISGTGNLTKSGSGTFTLASANAFSGNTDINAGTLNIENSSALGTSAATVSSGATLGLTGNGLSVGNNLTLNDSGELVDNSSNSSNTYSGNIALGSNSTLEVTNSDTLLNLSGVMSGSDGFTKTGNGTLIVSGSNNYSGTTTINSGTLTVQNPNGLGAAAGNAVVENGATLNLDNVTINGESLTLNGTGVNNEGALLGTGTSFFTGNINLASDSNIGVVPAIGVLTLSQKPNGPGEYTKVGPGTLIILGENTQTSPANNSSNPPTDTSSNTTTPTFNQGILLGPEMNKQAAAKLNNVIDENIEIADNSSVNTIPKIDTAAIENRTIIPSATFTSLNSEEGGAKKSAFSPLNGTALLFATMASFSPPGSTLNKIPVTFFTFNNRLGFRRIRLNVVKVGEYLERLEAV